MFRLLASAAAVAVLAGCAATQPVVIERDSVDSLIAQSAANATQALRDLSESTGNSRVVMAAPKPASPAAAPAPATVAPPAPAPLPVVHQSIASRSGSIAVEVLTPPPPPAPAAAVIAAPSTGVVASGGLLSAPPPGLERLVTVRWTGDLEELLSRVAQESGWRLAPATGLRVTPVIISISAENRTAFDVLRDIGAIAGTSADILVSAPTRTISVRYPQR